MTETLHDIGVRLGWHPTRKRKNYQNRHPIGETARYVIRARAKDPDITMSEMARQAGVTPVRIRQIVLRLGMPTVTARSYSNRKATA